MGIHRGWRRHKCYPPRYIKFNYKIEKTRKADMYKRNTIIREIKEGRILGEKIDTLVV